MKLRITFTTKAKKATPDEETTTRRDWKFIIGVFVIVMIFVAWLFWLLYGNMSNTNPSEEPLSQTPTLDKELLERAVNFYKTESANYDIVSKSPQQILPDPSI